MAKKIIHYCDVCGKELNGEGVYEVYVRFKMRNEWPVKHETLDFDFCTDCMKKVQRRLVKEMGTPFFKNNPLNLPLNKLR